MSAPTITPNMVAWAAAYVLSVAEVARITGQPIDLAHAERSIREALTTPRRWTPGDDVEGDDDPGSSRELDRMADGAAAQEFYGRSE